ncbi:MAG: alanine racemase, partial [Armatimonadetes bacterium]|nr:alanine racemase [Armatimonadota bacterium]
MMGRPAWVEVDLAAIRHNVRCACERVGAGCGVMAVVKANAYGHGLREVAAAALDAGAARLGVAVLDEAVALRRAGCAAPILALGMALASDAEELVAHDVAAALSDFTAAEALAAAARRQGKAACAHLKVDSGMGRAGVPAGGALALLRRLRSLAGLTVEGIFTHFATADEPDLGFAREQAVLFQECLDRARAAGVLPPVAHAANSAAILRLPQARHSLVRAGLVLYGIPPFPGAESRVPIRPALRLKARLVSVKDLPCGAGVGYGRAYVMERPGRIAIVPLGYGDGFSRHNSNRGDVLLHGRRAPIRG